MRRGPARALFAAAMLFAATVPGQSLAQQQPLGCTIEKAHARVWATINEGGQVVYYGHALMDTKDCNQYSPADITVTFRPMAGAASSCDPTSTVQSDMAVCTTGLGAAVQGTQVLITATGKTFGTGGASAFVSACTLVMPAYDEAACSFPIRLTS